LSEERGGSESQLNPIRSAEPKKRQRESRRQLGTEQGDTQGKGTKYCNLLEEKRRTETKKGEKGHHDKSDFQQGFLLRPRSARRKGGTK